MNTPTILFYTSVASLTAAVVVLGLYYFTKYIPMSVFTTVFGLLLALGIATAFASYYLTEMKYINDSRHGPTGYPSPPAVRYQDSVDAYGNSVKICTRDCRTCPPNSPSCRDGFCTPDCKF